MPLFGRHKKNALSQSQSRSKSPKNKEKPSEPEPSEPPALEIWNGEHSVWFTVSDPWRWVVRDVASESNHIRSVETPSDLPTGQLASDDPNAGLTPSRRRRKKARKPSTLKVEVTASEGGELLAAAHGSSEAFDGLEDKDELLRTIQRCRCEDLELSPPSKLLNWDATKDECMNLIGDQLPGLSTNKKNGGGTRMAVLKEPMGTCGTGVYFVKDVEEIAAIIDEHRKRANDEPEFLDNLIAVKGRIPSWVLQAEVRPCLLIRGRRKFHIRTYVVAVEKLHLDALMEVSVYKRHEVRVAAIPVPEDAPEDSRERKAHITNGALSETTERILLTEVPELMQMSMQDKLEEFVFELFGKHFVPDMVRRVGYSASQEPSSLDVLNKFAVAGLDIMVSESGQLYLLEVNVNPASPPEASVTGTFKEHLNGFMTDLMDLAVGRPSPNFISCETRQPKA